MNNINKVKISKDGWLIGPNHEPSDTDIEIEVSSEVRSKIGFIPFSQNWRYVNGEFVLQDLIDDEHLRIRRQNECFNIIDNRSRLWFDNLSSERRTELDSWYQAWLNVTETHIIPIKPEWLK